MKAFRNKSRAGVSVILLSVFTAAFLYASGAASAKDEKHNHDHVAAALEKAAAKSAVKNSDGLRGGETRQTMSPSNFTGDTARSYRIAKEIPEVLDSLHCYCDCKRHSGHKSLLSCYVNEHAAHCDVCQNSAFIAYELHKKGKSVKEIRSAVDKEYSNLSH